VGASSRYQKVYLGQRGIKRGSRPSQISSLNRHSSTPFVCFPPKPKCTSTLSQLCSSPPPWHGPASSRSSKSSNVTPATATRPNLLGNRNALLPSPRPARSPTTSGSTRPSPNSARSPITSGRLLRRPARLPITSGRPIPKLAPLPIGRPLRRPAPSLHPAARRGGEAVSFYRYGERPLEAIHSKYFLM
jgi:hypothetical protein